jgi:hypothetical protein
VPIGFLREQGLQVDIAPAEQEPAGGTAAAPASVLHKSAQETAAVSR